MKPGARYIWRMDDITPDMDWQQFWRFMMLFEEYGVIPLLGVVPDNRDSYLSVYRSNSNFWKILQQIQQKDAAEIAQHGYQHTSIGWQDSRIWGPRQTEFAGLSYDEQYKKILAGREILSAHGIRANTWMSPYHTCDDTTYRVLADLGFLGVTDGVGLFPYQQHGLTFVPQQVWRPRRLPCGVVTICLHVNGASEMLYQEVRSFLASGVQSIRFQEALSIKCTFHSDAINRLFTLVYLATAMYRARRH